MLLYRDASNERLTHAPIPQIPERQTRSPPWGIAAVDRGDPSQDWADPSCTRPRIKILGPVSMWAAGPTDKVSSKMPAIYAVLGSDGVIVSQIAAMADVETTNVRSRLADLRQWLGNQPDDTPWLPPPESQPPMFSMPFELSFLRNISAAVRCHRRWSVSMPFGL